MKRLVVNMLQIMEAGGRVTGTQANKLLGSGNVYSAVKRGWLRRIRVDAHRVDYQITERGKRYVMDTLLEEVERAVG